MSLLLASHETDCSSFKQSLSRALLLFAAFSSARGAVIQGKNRPIPPPRTFSCAEAADETRCRMFWVRWHPSQTIRNQSINRKVRMRATLSRSSTITVTVCIVSMRCLVLCSQRRKYLDSFKISVSTPVRRNSAPVWAFEHSPNVALTGIHLRRRKSLPRMTVFQRRTTRQFSLL